MIYFIHGPDRLLAKQAALAISADIDPDGASTTWIDGRAARADSLTGAIGTASLFGAPRVVIVSDHLSGANRDPQGGDSAPTVDDQSPKPSSLASLFAAVPEQNCLILFEPSLAAPPAAVKSATLPVTIIAGDPPRGPALVAWIETAVRQAGARIDGRSAQSLAVTLFPQTWDRKPANPRFDRPPDMTLLAQEIEKLALAAHPGPITAEHIRELVPGGPDQRVFRFLDAALGGDLRAAMTELERLAVAGEEPAMILAQTLGQVELAAVAAAAAGRDAGSVARDLATVTPARMSAVMASARRNGFSADYAIESGVAIDRNLKTGRIRRPDDALRELVLALAPRSRARTTGHSG